MNDPPTYPPLASVADELLASGHVWLFEAVRGEPFRFQLEDTGVIRIGDATRETTDSDDLPLRLHATVRHVREHFDRTALRRAVDDVATVTFHGIATCWDGVTADWPRLPPFLGLDVHDATKEAYRPPDAAAAIYEELGLAAAPVVAQELRVRDFDPAGYDFPRATYADTPAAGVLVRRKGGGRARLDNPAVPDDPPVEPFEADVDAVLAAVDIDVRIARLTDEGEDSVEEIADRLLEACYREYHHRLAHSSCPVDSTTLRSALAQRVHRTL